MAMEREPRLMPYADQLVGAMGGEIRVASELGRGTEFSFSLRLKHADTRDRDASTRSTPARYEGLRQRVLVIDDVDHNRSMLADFLTSLGFEIQIAEDGLQGIDKVQSFLPDLIVMDSLMPVMSGLEATRRLRANPAHAHLPIIAVSANATEEHRHDCLQAGANLCFSKPVRLDGLASAIQHLLQLAPRPRTFTAMPTPFAASEEDHDAVDGTSGAAVGSWRSLS